MCGVWAHANDNNETGLISISYVVRLLSRDISIFVDSENAFKAALKGHWNINFVSKKSRVFDSSSFVKLSTSGIQTGTFKSGFSFDEHPVLTKKISLLCCKNDCFDNKKYICDKILATLFFYVDSCLIVFARVRESRGWEGECMWRPPPPGKIFKKLMNKNKINFMQRSKDFGKKIYPFATLPVL